MCSMLREMRNTYKPLDRKLSGTGNSKGKGKVMLSLCFN
jgi:hypothetical protein